jgi:hypothetical protein
MMVDERIQGVKQAGELNMIPIPIFYEAMLNKTSRIKLYRTYFVFAFHISVCESRVQQKINKTIIKQENIYCMQEIGDA